eukprot:scaffold571_cov364-Prasinococcus_capsulatus_cf.AAC.19
MGAKRVGPGGRQQGLRSGQPRRRSRDTRAATPGTTPTPQLERRIGYGACIRQVHALDAGHVRVARVAREREAVARGRARRQLCAKAIHLRQRRYLEALVVAVVRQHLRHADHRGLVLVELRADEARGSRVLGAVLGLLRLQVAVPLEGKVGRHVVQGPRVPGPRSTHAAAQPQRVRTRRPTPLSRPPPQKRSEVARAAYRGSPLDAVKSMATMKLSKHPPLT